MYDYDDYDDDRMHFGLVHREDWVWEGNTMLRFWPIHRKG